MNKRMNYQEAAILEQVYEATHADENPAMSGILEGVIKEWCERHGYMSHADMLNSMMHVTKLVQRNPHLRGKFITTSEGDYQAEYNRKNPVQKPKIEEAPVDGSKGEGGTPDADGKAGVHPRRQRVGGA